MRRAWAGWALILTIIAGCGSGEDRLIPPALIKDDGIIAPLGNSPGDPERGAETFVSRNGGHCVLCHVLDSVNAPFQGNVGPALSGIGDRLSPAQLRLRIAQPSVIWPDTLMPSYYSLDGLNQVAPAYQGETILSADEVEDLVAFLSTQRSDDD